jgi:sulfide:quinone oxidoreductase
MSDTAPLRVLIAGGGVAALEAALALRALAADRVSVELLAPGTQFPHRPSSVMSPFSGEDAPQVSWDRVQMTLHRGSLESVGADAHDVLTTDGGRLRYDRLLVATGARAIEAVPGATTFRGPVSAGLVDAAIHGARERVIFVLPAESAWGLPVYELALLAASERKPSGPDLMIVTPEARPLDVFGRTASDAVARLLDRAGVEFVGETAVDSVLGDALITRDGQMLRADAVVALPRLEPRVIPGLPEGFLEIDEHARVVGVADVFAAGDNTAEPVKQGGLATQQADAAAERIAFEAGAEIEPRPYRPVLRGLLLTGEAPLYMRTDLGGRGGLARALRYEPPRTSRAPLWWPDQKIVGRYLAGYLAAAR